MSVDVVTNGLLSLFGDRIVFPKENLNRRQPGSSQILRFVILTLLLMRKSWRAIWIASSWGISRGIKPNPHPSSS
jgi:hypothetical protein